MPLPYSLDLRWRIVWVYLTQNLSQSRIGLLFSVSDRTVGRVISLFNQTGDVKPRSRRNGPICVMQDFEQLSLVQLIITHPGIYLHEIQEKLLQIGIIVSLSNICRTFKKMGVTRQAMHHIALQQSDYERAKYMAEISMYDPSMLVFIDETGCDRRNTIRKYGYSFRGMPVQDRRLLVRGARYSTIPVMSLSGIHDVYLREGTVNGEVFAEFVDKYLLPCLMPFNGINARSVVVMDNASIHHVEEVRDLIEDKAGARLHFLPPYSPDLMPAEGVFSQVKSIIKGNNSLFETCSECRVLLLMCFGLITAEDCYAHMQRCGYI